MKEALTFFSICACLAPSLLADPAPPPAMVWVPGGEAAMGTDEEAAYAVERPAHRVSIDGFWMDETEVTNAQL